MSTLSGGLNRYQKGKRGEENDEKEICEKQLRLVCLLYPLAATATNWVAPNAFVEVAHAEETVTMNIQFKAGEEVVAGGEYSVPAGVQNYSVFTATCSRWVSDDDNRRFHG